jgi:hypothetical protein
MMPTNSRHAATAIITAALLFGGTAEAKQPRSSIERHAFVKAVACPVTDRHRLPCPGYIIDHIEPLCAGGADHRSNMQWQTVEDAKIKDRGEREMCRRKPR